MYLNYATSQSDYRCGMCICYDLHPQRIMDCKQMELNSLPLLLEQDTIGLTSVFLNDNSITKLDQDILDSWISLKFIDLRGNPLICTELSKLSKNVQVLENCQEASTSTGRNIKLYNNNNILYYTVIY